MVSLKFWAVFPFLLFHVLQLTTCGCAHAYILCVCKDVICLPCMLISSLGSREEPWWGNGRGRREERRRKKDESSEEFSVVGKRGGQSLPVVSMTTVTSLSGCYLLNCLSFCTECSQSNEQIGVCVCMWENVGMAVCVSRFWKRSNLCFSRSVVTHCCQATAVMATSWSM